MSYNYNWSGTIRPRNYLSKLKKHKNSSGKFKRKTFRVRFKFIPFDTIISEELVS